MSTNSPSGNSPSDACHVRYRPLGAARSHDPISNLTFVRGSGPHVWDDQGRRYLDFIGGYSCCSLGHSHPRLVAAAMDQLQRITLSHAGNSEARNALEEKLCRVFGRPFSAPKVWLTTGGARAVELAWKIASAHRSGGVLRFDLAYHGRSLATATISDTARAGPFRNPPDPDLTIPYPVNASSGSDELAQSCRRSLELAREVLATHHGELSMLLMEPAIGSRGYYFAPPWFCKQLADLAHHYGLLVVSDEIQMGLGRLGAWSVANEDGWKPDLIILGKALGGGMVSMGAVLGAARLMDGLPEGIESETYAAMPLGCRIGLEVLELLDQQGFVASAVERGERWRREIREVLPASITVDGRGMATVLQFSADRGSGADAAKNWAIDLSRLGLLLHLTGPARDRLAVIPPLNASWEAMEQARDILARKAKS
jgi:4-aminobutyrate aminotransferase-like enzyme